MLGRSYYRPKVMTDKQRSNSRGIKDLLSEIPDFDHLTSIELGTEQDDEQDAPVVEQTLPFDPWDTYGYAVEPEPESFETYQGFFLL